MPFGSLLLSGSVRTPAARFFDRKIWVCCSGLACRRRPRRHPDRNDHCCELPRSRTPWSERAALKNTCDLLPPCRQNLGHNQPGSFSAHVCRQSDLIRLKSSWQWPFGLGSLLSKPATASLDSSRFRRFWDLSIRFASRFRHRARLR